MALRLPSKTYWRGTQIRFRRPVDAAAGVPVAIDAADGARLHGVWWTARRNPKVAVIAAHPRVDFSEHHAFPDLLDAGYGCLGANLRTLNNDADCLHEKLLVDVAAYMAWLRARGVEKIVLLGNSGGGSLFSFYQSEARKRPADRIRHAPGGRATFLDRTEMPPGDGIVFMAAHAGQGLILNQVIDPAVVDESDPLKTDPALDMYDPANGFAPPPQWSRYAPEFVARYRAVQIARIRRLDDRARELIADAADAAGIHASADFEALAPADQREVLRREAFEPMLLVYRTMAEPALVIHAGRDLDVYPQTHSRLIFDTIASADKQYWNFDDALHYFEAEDGADGNPALDALMARLVPWIEQRFPL